MIHELIQYFIYPGKLRILIREHVILVCKNIFRCFGFQSPTRRNFVRRSESPVLRPSPLLRAKRKLDERDVDFSISPRPKRVNTYSVSDGRGLLTTTTNSLQGKI